MINKLPINTYQILINTAYLKIMGILGLSRYEFLKFKPFNTIIRSRTTIYGAIVILNYILINFK